MRKSNLIVQNYILDTIVSAEEYEDSDYFSTFEYKSNENIWLQFKHDCVNVHYPFTENPKTKLKELGISYRNLEITDWEEKLYLTLDFEVADLENVSEFVMS